MTGILETSHFSSEKRCKDKQKNEFCKDTTALTTFFNIVKAVL